MTDDEFDFIDEIYFVTAYGEIKHQLGWDDARVLACILSLWEKGWIRCYTTAADELLNEEVQLPEAYQNYHYLATKQGLLAHHGR